MILYIKNDVSHGPSAVNSLTSTIDNMIICLKINQLSIMMKWIILFIGFYLTNFIDAVQFVQNYTSDTGSAETFGFPLSYPANYSQRWIITNTDITRVC
jgi:hypothetical protein